MLYRWGRENDCLGIKVNSVKIIDIIKNIYNPKNIKKEIIDACVLISPQKPGGHIHIKVEFGEGEGKVPIDKMATRVEKYKVKEDG